jgi:hypothetical protein
MAIVVETGVGTLASANSYVTIASCTAYLDSKGLTTWGTSTTTVQEVSLINSCMWMEILPWKGQKSLSTDPLVWPRRSVFDRDGYPVLSTEIPRDIKRGQMELAYRSFLNRNPFVDIVSGDGYITKEVVGPVEISYSTGYSTSYKFPEIDNLFAPYLDSSLNVLLERA